jgi:16S rRNA (guanine1207-N2)-methyltransferase
MAIVYLQKGREVNAMVLSMIRRSLHQGATLFLVGENNAGIRSYRESVEQSVGPISYSDAARHCVLYQAVCSVQTPDSAEGLESWVREYDIAVGGRELTVVSLPGIFSHGRIDKGTAFLLDHITAPDCGDVLDFGCGAGVIGAVVKLLKPLCNVTLIDSNAFAIEASRRTFAKNSISAQAILPSDVFSAVSSSYDLIVSNPPFHQGIGTDYETVTNFIFGARQHLRDHGTLMIVANRFLRYEPLLLRDVGPTVIAAEDKAYKVFVAKKGASAILQMSPRGHAVETRR